jgi:hypothetical protein
METKETSNQQSDREKLLTQWKIETKDESKQPFGDARLSKVRQGSTGRRDHRTCAIQSATHLSSAYRILSIYFPTSRIRCSERI